MMVYLYACLSVLFGADSCRNFVDSVLSSAGTSRLMSRTLDSVHLQMDFKKWKFYGDQGRVDFSKYIESHSRTNRENGYELMWFAKGCRRRSEGVCKAVHESDLLLVRAAGGDTVVEESILQSEDVEKIALINTTRGWGTLDSIVHSSSTSDMLRCKILGEVWYYILNEDCDQCFSSFELEMVGLGGAFSMHDCRIDLYAAAFNRVLIRNGSRPWVGDWLKRCIPNEIPLYLRQRD